MVQQRQDFAEPPRPESSFPFGWIARLCGFLDVARVCAPPCGRRSPLNLFMVTTSPVQCGRGCLSRRRLSSDRRAVLWQASHSPVSPRLRRRFDSSVFRVLLLRRLWPPLPPSSRFCRWGLLLGPLGHHWEACGGAGVLGSPSLRIGKRCSTCLP